MKTKNDKLKKTIERINEEKRKRLILNFVYILVVPIGIGTYFGITEENILIGFGVSLGALTALMFVFGMSKLTGQPDKFDTWDIKGDKKNTEEIKAELKKNNPNSDTDYSKLIIDK